MGMNFSATTTWVANLIDMRNVLTNDRWMRWETDLVAIFFNSLQG